MDLELSLKVRLNLQGQLFYVPQLVQILFSERQRSANQRIQNDAQRPNVRFAAIVLFALKQFGRCVWQGATESIEKVARIVVIAEAEICLRGKGELAR